MAPHSIIRYRDWSISVRRDICGTQGQYYRIDFTELKYENETFDAVREVYLENAKKIAFDEEVYALPSIRLADGGEYFPVNTELSNGEYWTRLDYVVRLDANADTRGSIVLKVGNKQTKKLEFKLEPADADPSSMTCFGVNAANTTVAYHLIIDQVPVRHGLGINTARVLHSCQILRNPSRLESSSFNRNASITGSMTNALMP